MKRTILAALAALAAAFTLAAPAAPAAAASFSQVCATARYSDGKIAATACISKDFGPGSLWYVNDRLLYNPGIDNGGHTDEIYEAKYFGNGHSLLVPIVDDNQTRHTASDTWTEGSNTVYVKLRTTYFDAFDCMVIYFNRAGGTSQQYIHNCVI